MSNKQTLDEYLEDLNKKVSMNEVAKKIAALKELRIKKTAGKPSEFRMPTQVLEGGDPLQNELERIFMEGL